MGDLMDDHVVIFLEGGGGGGGLYEQLSYGPFFPSHISKA